jgi:WD40 repeat protein
MVTMAAINPKGKSVVAGSLDGTARLWGLERLADDSRCEPRILRGHGKAILRGALSPDGRRAATLSMDGTVRVWSLGGAHPLERPQVIDFKAGRPDWGGFGDCAVAESLLTVATSDGRPPRQWDLGGALPVARPEPAAPAIKERIHRLRLSPDHRWLAVSVPGGRLLLRQLTLPDASPVEVPKGNAAAISTFAFSPDSSRLVVSGGSSLQVWRLDGSSSQVTLERETSLENQDPVRSVVVSRDGGRLAAGTASGVVHVWVYSDGEPDPRPLTLSGHRRSVYALAFTKDGNRLISGSDDRTARVWDLNADAHHVDPVVLDGHEDRITSVAVSPDDNFVLTTSQDGTARLWTLPRDQLKRRIQEIIGLPAEQ